MTVILAALLTVSLIGAQKIRQNSRRQGESALEVAGRRQGALEAADLKSITKLNTEVKKQVALTFDDGPGPYTEKLLEGLREREVRATFFLIGENLAGREETVRRMVQDGHLIGSHTDKHVELTKRRFRRHCPKFGVPMRKLRLSRESRWIYIPSALRLLESGTGAGGLDDRGRVDGGSQRLGGKKHRYGNCSCAVPCKGWQHHSAP